MVSYGSSLALWVYLADWILALILGLAFVFWFPRLVGFVITQLLRLLVWRRFKIRISLGAFRISPLGGRITARNLIISNHDYTVSILRLNLTWRYWLFKPTRILEYFLPRNANLAEEHEGISSGQNKKLSSSIQLLLEGLEVFMYNRSFAYDNILEKLDLEMPGLKEAFQTHLGLTTSSATHASPKDSAEVSFEAVSSSSRDSCKQDCGSVGFLIHLLPISVRIKKGAFVVGNPTTPTILVASFKSAMGPIDYHTAPSSFDRYRTVYDLNMERFQISMKPNISYDPLRYSSEAFAHRGGVKTRHLLSLLRLKKAFKKLLLQRLLRNQDADLNKEWRGLRRYIDDFQDEHLMNLATIEEYAKYSVLLDSVSTQMIYSYDIPGITTTESLQKHPPKFGVDLILSQATFHYGPWADRQRGPLHALLFPALCRDSTPSPSREPFGSPRSYNGFDLNIIVKDELIIRTPTRELSKDREEIANTSAAKGNKITRPFGWLELKIGKNSRISSFNSYKATAKGWPNKLTCNFARPEMRSSVNHDVFFTADEHTIECDLSFPLKWNGETEWTFNNVSTNAQLFLLRDHVFLFTDLLSDFASGTPAPYEQFRPFKYNFNWTIKDYKLHFNVNDHNIINSALDFNNNRYICFHGGNLEISSVIPLLGTFVKSSTIDFKIFTDSLGLTLEVPPWHTASSFLRGDNKMGSADNFEITGSYTFYREIEINYSSFSVMNVIADNITLLFFGYFIRYLFTFRENYMGDFKNFKTFEEYTHGANLGYQDDSEASLRSMASEGSVKEKHEDAEPLYWNGLRTENDLNVQFTFKARNGLILLPCNMYDHTNNIGLTFDYLDVDIHLCHFYMDLQADFSPVTGYHFTRDTPGNYHGIIYDLDEYKRVGEEKGSDIIIDNFQVHTHRMLGLAPSLLTYQCKWDFSCASFVFDTHPSCLAGTKVFFANFITGFKDLENTFIYEIPLVFDMANFTFRCNELIIKLETGLPDTFFKVEIDDTLIAFNDRANERYSSKICVSMPRILVEVMNFGMDNKHSFFLETSLMFTDICQKAWPNDFRRNQQEWARRNDAPSHRIPFLIAKETKDSVYEGAYGCLPASVSLPNASVPLNGDYYLVRENRGYDDDLPSVESMDEPFCECESNEKMDPTISYLDEDFMPKMEQEPGYKTDAFILEFEAIKGFMSPLAVSAFVGLAQGFQVGDIEMMLDILQTKTVKDLKMFITPLNMCDNIRFVTPEINFSITQQPLLSPSDVLCSSPKVPFVTINIQEPSVAFTKVTTRVKSTNRVIEEEPIALALHIKSIICLIRDPQCFSPSMTILLGDFEAWLVKSLKDGLTTSLLLQDVKVSLFQDDVSWLFSFATDLAAEFENAVKCAPQKANAATIQKLIYLIGSVARTNGMEHDPTVLTKPSSILRTCDDHVRFYDGWKLATKFRNMVNKLPDQEYASLLAEVQNPDWQIPSTAEDEVASIFRLWRSWELIEAQRSIFFDDLFGNKPEEPETPSKIHFEASLFIIEIIEPEGKRDTFLAQGAKIICHKLTLPGETSKHAVLVDFDVLDALVSTISIQTASTVLKAAKKKKATSESDGLGMSDDEELASDQQSTALTAPRNSQNDQLLFTLLSVQLCHLKVQLPHTSVEFSTYNNINGLYKVGTTLCVASLAKEYSVCFGRGEVNHIEFTLTDSNLLVAQIGDLKKTHHLGFKLGDCDFKVIDADGVLLESARLLLDEDIPYLELKFDSGEKTPAKPEKRSNPFQLSQLPDFYADIELGHITFDIQVLSPLTVKFTTLRSKTSAKNQNGSLNFSVEYQRFFFDLMINDFPLLRFEDTNLQTSHDVTQIGDLWAIDSNLNLGFVKLTNLNITNSLHEVLKNWDRIKKRIADLKLLAPPKSSESKTKKESASSDPFDNIMLRARIKKENMNISTFKDQCRYTLELDGMAVSASNIHKTATGLVKQCLLFGDFSLPAMRVSVLDQSIPVGLSNMLDINLAAKVSNDNPEDTIHEHTRSLQIESEHIRICLSPIVLFKLVDIADLATRVYGSYDISSSSETNPEALETKTETSDNEVKKICPIVFSSVHVLFYNFCAGWLFGASYKDYPGLILGAERIFAVTKQEIGKLSLMEGYLSAANGCTSSSFYSILSELNSLNRAFMPKMQFNYCVSEGTSLWVDLKGDELDVRFMSNSLVMLERTVQSGSEVQEFFKGRMRTLQRRKSYMEQFPLKTRKKPSTPFKPPFSAVQTNISFAGSRVLFYRLQEENFQDAPPSLSLQSPSVHLAIFYKHMKQAVKKHDVKFEILMRLSDNTIYSSCVPVIMDFIEASKLMLRNSKEDTTEVDDFDDVPIPQTSEAGSSVGSILQDLEFHVGIIIEKQRLSLSCEPTAKVAAIVEFEGASILAANNLTNPSAIDAIARLDSLGASLQHIYSDEQSGFIGVKSMMTSNCITFEDTVKIVSSGSISDVTAYVKMKQYQDVDLFRDIWYPKRYQNVKKHTSTKLPTKRSQSKAKEVSSTYAIPLSVTFILSNVALEVDFGVALGVVLLDVNKGWFVTRKSSDWYYDMNLGLEEMRVGSRGRLGGYVLLEKFNAHSSVDWHAKGAPSYDVPLVKFAGGFENLTLKLAFDEHLFAVGNLEKWRIDIYNRKNGNNILKFHLFVIIKYKATEVFFTSFAASDLHDIFSTVSRMMDEKRTSYREILNDSNKEDVPSQDEVPMNKLLEVVKKLETNIEVRTGSTIIQVYPQTFHDSRVLYIQLDHSTASFFQNEYTLGVSNEIELKFNNLTASLSIAAGITKEKIESLTVPEFASYARKAKGGNIFLSPKFMISMRTFQPYNSNVIEYLFQSSFGGTVDVRWNLGSVNCVREMYAAHRRALASRTEYSSSKVGTLRDTTDIEKTVLGLEVPGAQEDDSRGDYDSEQARKAFDRDINNTFEKVAKGSKFKYVPLAPPIIEAPRLKELGNATPPLEWFGLHRDKFPDATHQFAIVTLQKLLHEIEGRYSKALGTP